MTYCLGITVKEGLIAIADTRITAGNEMYSNKKISIHEINKHSLFIMTAGLRSVRDKAVTYFNQKIEEEESSYDYMFQAQNLGQGFAASTMMLLSVLIVLIPWAYLEFGGKKHG